MNENEREHKRMKLLSLKMESIGIVRRGDAGIKLSSHWRMELILNSSWGWKGVMLKTVTIDQYDDLLVFYL